MTSPRTSPYFGPDTVAQNWLYATDENPHQFVTAPRAPGTQQRTAVQSCDLSEGAFIDPESGMLVNQPSQKDTRDPHVSEKKDKRLKTGQAITKKPPPRKAAIKAKEKFKEIASQEERETEKPTLDTKLLKKQVKELKTYQEKLSSQLELAKLESLQLRNKLNEAVKNQEILKTRLDRFIPLYLSEKASSDHYKGEAMKAYEDFATLFADYFRLIGTLMALTTKV